MSRLRWGLLSTARINRLIIPAIRASARSEVTAVASRDMDKCRAYATEWKIPRALGSYEALLDDPDVDVIYISLPNSLHAEWTVRAVEAGKHVLCEKPLALHTEDVDRIEAAARRAGRAAAEAFMYRHHPLTHAVQAVVKSGRLGELRGFKGAFTFPLTRDNDVRLNAALGGGSLWDVGCYPVSYACFRRMTRQRRCSDGNRRYHRAWTWNLPACCASVTAASRSSIAGSSVRSARK